METKILFEKMGKWCMRLVVPIGDKGAFLVSDPRFSGHADLSHPSEPVEPAYVIELIRKGFIFPLPEFTDPEILSGKRGGKIGWREMFPDDSIVPQGAQVYALRNCRCGGREVP